MTDPRRGGGWRAPVFTLAVLGNVVAVAASGAPVWVGFVTLTCMAVAWYIGTRDEEAKASVHTTEKDVK